MNRSTERRYNGQIKRGLGVAITRIEPFSSAICSLEVRRLKTGYLKVSPGGRAEVDRSIKFCLFVCARLSVCSTDAALRRRSFGTHGTPPLVGGLFL